MYEFRDITDNSGARILPAEALKINGLYLEEEIPGYRTLYVKGRESLAPEIEKMEIGSRDGARLTKRRYPPRYITVGYQLKADDPNEFRMLFNRLSEFVELEDSELIFNDEPDKFFIGTIDEIEDVPPGRNAINGEIVFICADPFKYSVTEYEAVPTEAEPDIIQIDYHGTHNSAPVFQTDFYTENEAEGDVVTELTGTGDCGFVSFFNEDERIVQIGDPDEDEGEDLPPSQTLTSQNFTKKSHWGNATKGRWVTNAGISSSSAIVQTGSLGVYPASSGSATHYLKAANYGSGTKYHGASVVRTLPADESGHVGARDFKFTYRQKTAIGKSSGSVNQRGVFQALVLHEVDGVRKILAGVSIYKSKSGKLAQMKIFVNHRVVYTRNIDISYYNRYFGNNRPANRRKKIKARKAVRTSSIIKQGEKISFSLGGIKKTFYDESLADAEALQVQFYFGKYGSKTPLSYNGIFWAKFIKNNCATWKDVPNKFSANDVLTADCRTGTIELNDTESPELGAVGNDWESFRIEPGINRIGVAYSNWVPEATKPSFKVRYREVFL